MAGRIRFPIKTPRLTIRPMEVGDAEALLSVYGEIETMQHLSSDLPTTVAEAREWVQTKIDLFDRDDQLSLWTGDPYRVGTDRWRCWPPVRGIRFRSNGRPRWTWKSTVLASEARIRGCQCNHCGRIRATGPVGKRSRDPARKSSRTSTTDQTGHATRRNEHPRLAGLLDHS